MLSEDGRQIPPLRLNYLGKEIFTSYPTKPIKYPENP